jgi:hypothetical protein
MAWLSAFLLTVAFEAPVLAAFLPGRGIRSAVACSLLLNLASHPLLWFVLPSVFPPERYVLFGESAVILLECGLLASFVGGVSLRRAFAASLSMNVVSFFMGAMLYSQGII